MGVDKAMAAEFLKCKAFSPSQQTRFLAALHAVRAAGLADYVDAAREAAGEIEAEFFTESAEMLAALHAARAGESGAHGLARHGRRRG